MNAKTDQLTTAEHEWIAQQIAAAKAFVHPKIGEDTTDLPSPEDPEQPFKTWLLPVSRETSEANSVINCVDFLLPAASVSDLRDG